MEKKKRPFRTSLYVKFAMVIILVGIIPIALLSTVILNKMFQEFEKTLKENIAQGLKYSAYTVETIMDKYNDLSKFSYYYNYSSDGDFAYDYQNYDNLRKILTGEAFVNVNEQEIEESIEQQMHFFLVNLLGTNSNLEAVHFLYGQPNENAKVFHAGNYSNVVNNTPLFLQRINVNEIDTTSKKLQIIPTHAFDYIRSTSTLTKNVITVARNYFDLSYVIGQEKYVGVLLLDLRIDELAEVFRGMDLHKEGVIYVTDDKGNCVYSTNTNLTGKNLQTLEIAYNTAQKGELLLQEKIGTTNLTIYCKYDSLPVESQIRDIQRVMYIVVALSVVSLLIGGLFFSHRLTKPIRMIMHEMAKVETGAFNVTIPVTSNDELGELTARFNKMANQLEVYTQQVYLSKIQQTQAELNALKSQIEPHFLYNTLEVIRMTSLSHSDEMVAQMIESLSEQIRYLIGTVEDEMPLKTEVAILEKYIYLINCRFDNKVKLTVTYGELESIMIPKLILQPIVENAFIHGIKDKSGIGYIMINARRTQNSIEIVIMDNGIGMDSETLKRQEILLAGTQPGHKNGEYQWESVGLKNVHDRIKFLYGEEYGITIVSTPKVGTAVTIHLPSYLGEDV